MTGDAYSEAVFFKSVMAILLSARITHRRRCVKKPSGRTPHARHQAQHAAGIHGTATRRMILSSKLEGEGQHRRLRAVAAGSGNAMTADHNG